MCVLWGTGTAATSARFQIGRPDTQKRPLQSGRFRGKSAREPGRSGSALRILPGNARDIRAGDTDIRELAVTELIEFAQAGVLAAPGAQETEDIGDQHVALH
jgi:hypothetical protein